jgi:hypothetical protein
MSACLSEQLNQQFRRRVYDFGLLIETRRRCHEPGDFQDPVHAFKRTQGLIQAGQSLKNAKARGFPGLVQAHFTADFARYQRVTATRQLPADECQAFVDGYRHILKCGRRGDRQFDAEFSQFFIDHLITLEMDKVFMYHLEIKLLCTI